MGLDRNNKTPCGFAFVEYYLHSEAVASMRYISGTKVDERVIRCDLDPGYKEGRQFGRGKSGGQVRDEFRQEYDSGRGEESNIPLEKANAKGAGVTNAWKRNDARSKTKDYGLKCSSIPTQPNKAV
jgi:RNA recognition motif-containing protein